MWFINSNKIRKELAITSQFFVVLLTFHIFFAILTVPNVEKYIEKNSRKGNITNS